MLIKVSVIGMIIISKELLSGKYADREIIICCKSEITVLAKSGEN